MEINELQMLCRNTGRISLMGRVSVRPLVAADVRRRIPDDNAGWSLVHPVLR